MHPGLCVLTASGCMSGLLYRAVAGRAVATFSRNPSLSQRIGSNQGTSTSIAHLWRPLLGRAHMRSGFSGASLFTAANSNASISLHTRAAFSTFAASAIDQVTFKQMGVLSWVLIDLGIQWVGWAVAATLKTEKFYDMLGTGAFFVLAVGSALACKDPTMRQVVVSGMVALWALRLGGMLVYRVHKSGKDSRFDEVKHQPGRFWIYWTLQAVWVAGTIMPLLLLNCSSAGGPLALVWTDLLGGALWATGMVIEGVADAQKLAFKSDPANAGKFIDVGLWSKARYPNYGGEMMIWWGVFCMCSSALKGAQLACVTSPLLVMFLLLRMSGVPLQDQQAQKRWGHTQEYQDYVARTHLLLPLPWAASGGNAKQ